MIGVRTYIPRASIGSMPSCEALVRPIFDAALLWNAVRNCCGVSVVVVGNREEEKAEFIDVLKADRVTGGRYPYVYVNVTYDPDQIPAEEFGPFAMRFDLLEVYQTVVPGILSPLLNK